MQDLDSLFAYISSTIPFNTPSIETLSKEEQSKLSGTEYIAGFVAKKLFLEHPNLKLSFGNNQVGWVQFLSDGQLVSPSQWWFSSFLKLEEFFCSYHKSHYAGQLNLNRKPGVIKVLYEYLQLKFPTIPKKALRFYVRLRTKIRINAINQKIVIIRKQRRAQAFINSMIMMNDGLNTENENSEDVAPEEVIFSDDITLEEEQVIFDEQFEYEVYDPQDFDLFEETEVLEAVNESNAMC